MEWDKGPQASISQIFDNAPLNEYTARPKKFRLDGSTKILLIGQDPAAATRWDSPQDCLFFGMI